MVPLLHPKSASLSDAFAMFATSIVNSLLKSGVLHPHHPQKLELMLTLLPRVTFFKNVVLEIEHNFLYTLGKHSDSEARPQPMTF